MTEGSGAWAPSEARETLPLKDSLPELEALLAELFVGLFEGARVFYADEVASTNDWGKTLPRRCSPTAAGLCDLRLLLADAQTAGRGRQGRAWHSPPAVNLYLSLVLDGSFVPAAANFLPLAAGLALYRTLAPLSALDLGLKWPNDLLVGGRKLAGILCESRLSSGGIERLVLGLGVNVGLCEYPEELRDKACSLRQIWAGQGVGRGALAAGYLRELALLLPECLGGDLSPGLLRAYEAHCINMGRHCAAQQANGTIIAGRACGLAADGALLLVDERGQTHTLFSGEVSLGSAPPLYQYSESAPNPRSEQRF